RVGDACARANHTTLAKHRLTFDRNARMNDAVATELRFRTDISVRRIDKGDANLDHQSPDRIPPQQILKLRQFGSRVDAGDFARIAVPENFNLPTVLQHDLG